MMKKRVEKSIVIKSPKERVFSFISDLSNYPKWSAASESKLIAGDGKLNSKYLVSIPTFLSRKNFNLEVTKYNYPDTFSFKNLSLLFPNETGFIISEGEGKINLTLFKEGNLSLLSSDFINSRTEGELLEVLSKIKKDVEVESNNNSQAIQQDDETIENENEIDSSYDDTEEEIKRRFKKRNY